MAKSHISRDPEIMGGSPCVRGTRIPTRAIRHFHEDGYTVAQIIGEYPSLTTEDVEAAIAYGRRRIARGDD